MTLPQTIAVTGGLGFVGRYLTPELQSRGGSVRLLTRGSRGLSDSGTSIVVVNGDLRDEKAVDELLDGSDALVHLAYPRDLSITDHETVARQIARAARRARLKRVVHVSTAVVVGSSDAAVVHEATPCNPRTSYERTKLRIEEVLRQELGDLPLVVLRPTAIFGPGGQNLRKLIDDLIYDSWPMRFGRLAVYGRRRLHLVCVENVVAAICHLLENGSSREECFIVSDDDAPSNNYEDVARFLAARFRIALPLGAALPLAPKMLPLLLKLRGRSILNPQTIFSPGRLLASGFVRPTSFEDGLKRFADWYEREQLRQ